MANPRVFFDITFGGKPTGRIVMELFADAMPLTVNNFLRLFSGKGFTLQSVHPGEHCALCLNSVEDEEFLVEDTFERFANNTTCTGIMSLLMESSNLLSPFFIYFRKVPDDELKHVFGQVIEGHHVVNAIEKLGSYLTTAAVIADWGHLPLNRMSMEISECVILVLKNT